MLVVLLVEFASAVISTGRIFARNLSTPQKQNWVCVWLCRWSLELEPLHAILIVAAEYDSLDWRYGVVTAYYTELDLRFCNSLARFQGLTKKKDFQHANSFVTLAFVQPRNLISRRIICTIWGSALTDDYESYNNLSTWWGPVARDPLL